jgi:hypothetical protein
MAMQEIPMVMWPSLLLFRKIPLKLSSKTREVWLGQEQLINSNTIVVYGKLKMSGCWEG